MLKSGGAVSVLLYLPESGSSRLKIHSYFGKMCIRDRLYASLGFEKAGVRRDFYKAPREDALIFTLYF